MWDCRGHNNVISIVTTLFYDTPQIPFRRILLNLLMLYDIGIPRSRVTTVNVVYNCVESIFPGTVWEPKTISVSRTGTLWFTGPLALRCSTRPETVSMVQDFHLFGLLSSVSPSQGGSSRVRLGLPCSFDRCVDDVWDTGGGGTLLVKRKSCATGHRIRKSWSTVFSFFGVGPSIIRSDNVPLRFLSTIEVMLG